MPHKKELPKKTCQRCGRSFQWRSRWAQVWDEVKYCGERCRRSRPDSQDAALEAAIMALLSQRARGATICPSEAARSVLPADVALTQAGMEKTRQAARRLIARGELEMLQKNKVVSPDTARGPVRLRQAARRLP